jgi:hypothetical protein
MKLLINEQTSYHYTNEDYAHLFYHMFYEFVKEKNPSVTPRTSVSFLMNKYLKQFVEHFNLSENSAFTNWRLGSSKEKQVRGDAPIYLGRELVEKSIVDFDKFSNDYFFTKRFRNLIKRSLNNIDEDGVFKISFHEEEPLEVNMTFDVNWDDVLRRQIKEISSTKVYSDLISELKDLGFPFGNPDYGMLSITTDNSPMNNSFENWIKDFGKKLRQNIKKSDLDEYIKSISFTQPAPHVKPVNIKVTLKNASDYGSWYNRSSHEYKGQKMSASEKVNSILFDVKNIIESMGYNMENFNVNSPTQNRI